MEFSLNGKKFLLRSAKSPQVKLMNNKSFAKVVQQGAEMCFLSLEQVIPQFYIPSCHLLHTNEVLPSLPPPISKLLAEYDDIFLELLIYPLQDWDLIIKFLLRRVPFLSTYDLTTYDQVRMALGEEDKLPSRLTHAILNRWSCHLA